MYFISIDVIGPVGLNLGKFLMESGKYFYMILLV